MTTHLLVQVLKADGTKTTIYDDYGKDAIVTKTEWDEGIPVITINPIGYAEAGRAIALLGGISDSTDYSAGIKGVQVFVDGILAAPGTLTSQTSWAASVIIKTAGTHTIKAVVTDNAGHTGQVEASVNVNILVINPITKLEFDPLTVQDGQTISGTSKKISVIPVDANGIDNVILNIDGKQFTKPDGTTSERISPYDFVVDTTKLANNQHTLEAVATDKLDTSIKKSVMIKVVVNNAVTTTTSTTTTGAPWTEYFDLPNKVYTIDGFQLADGKFKNVYLGYGSAAIENQLFWQKPKAQTTDSVTNPDQSTSGTSSCLTLSTERFVDFEFEAEMCTVAQVAGRIPNAWEVGWLMFNYIDEDHHNYLSLKTSGFEFGGKDNPVHVESQRYFATPTTPKVVLGQWYKWTVRCVKRVFNIWLQTVTINADGSKTYGAKQQLVTNYADSNGSTTLYPSTGGRVGLYLEDAYVKYDNIKVTPIV